MAECRGFKNKLGTTIVSLIAKVTGAVAGNIATFNNDGELADSGKAISTLDTLAEKVSILEKAVENLSKPQIPEKPAPELSEIT